MAQGEATETIAGRGFRLRREVFDDLEDTLVRQRLGDLRLPLLILRSPTAGQPATSAAR